MSEELTPRGHHYPGLVEGRECRGCKKCELMCPDMAIYIETPRRRRRAVGRARA